MITTVVLLFGFIFTIWCVLDIFKKNISPAGKIIASVIVLLTNWVGLLVYYFYARHHIREWFR